MASKTQKRKQSRNPNSKTSREGKEKKLAWCEADDLLLVHKDEPPAGTKERGVEFKVEE